MAVGGYGNVSKIYDAPTNVTFFNVAVGTPATEESQALPANTKEFIIRSRGKAKIQLAYATGDTGSLFVTIEKNGVYNDSNFYPAQTLFFETNIVDTIEIVAFT